MIVDSWLKINKDEVNLDILKAQMTVPNPDYLDAEYVGRNTEDIPRMVPLYEEHDDELWIPRAQVTRFNGNAKLVDKTTTGEKVDFKSKIVLNNKTKDQDVFVDSLESAVRKQYGAIGNAGCGYGKTVCTLETVARLGYTTLVVVHKEFLVDQWIERIQTFYDIKPDEIGRVQQEVCVYKGKKIVVALVQSLLSKDYPEEFYKYFGVIVFDEVHRFAATTFRNAIVMFPARYRIGVTATARRKDGCENVFFWHIGNIAAVGKSEQKKANVYMVRSKIMVKSEKPFMIRGMVNLQKVLTYLTEYVARNRLLVKYIKDATDKGRKVIILSHRLEHLATLKEMFEEDCKLSGCRVTTAYYVGGMTRSERVIAETRQVIFGSYQMAQEGLDIPDLDTLILATPGKDVEQAVGRILRECDEKKDPVVVDMVDPIGICQGLFRARMKLYKELGYNVFLPDNSNAPKGK